MKLERLKWLVPDHPELKSLNVKVHDQCLVYRENTSGLVTGLTVFEPRYLDLSVLGRLKKRIAEDAGSGAGYRLIIPPAFKFRAEMSLKTANVTDLKIEFSPFLHIRQEEGRFEIRRKLRVANVDDSPVLLKFLKNICERFPYMEVVGQTSEPMKANDLLRQWNPDVVTMDIQMPRKDGVEVVREIMRGDPLPVIMISSLGLSEGSQVFEALNSGAFDYIQKPKLEERDEFASMFEEKLLAAACGRQLHPRELAAMKKSVPRVSVPTDVIWCLGASTGGTQALTNVFTSLPDQIPPVIVVQHIPPVFSKAFATSLDGLCPFKVKEAEDGDIVQSNHVYIAAGGMQLGVERDGSGRLVLRLLDAEKVNRFKPSVDFMFNQVAKLKGVRVVAGVLTGMGRDGADGLLNLKNAGAGTFAQDEKSSTVYGMPRACAENGSAMKIVALENVAQTLLEESGKVKMLSGNLTVEKPTG